VASHLLKTPFIDTDALTKNSLEFPSGAITKTGASARVTHGNTADAKRQRIVNRIRTAQAENLSRFIVALIVFSSIYPALYSAFVDFSISTSPPVFLVLVEYTATILITSLEQSGWRLAKLPPARG